MIKKLLFGLLGLVYFTGISFAGLGISARGGKLFGGGTFDKYNKQQYYFIYGYQDYEMEFFNYSADIFFEKKINNEIFGFYGYGYIGVKAGYTKYVESKYKLHMDYYGENEFTITSNAYAIPIMVYYKYEYENNERVRAWGGLGAVLLYNEFEYNSYGLIFGDDAKSETKTSVMPQLEIGAEYMFTRMTSVFLSLGYQFNGLSKASFETWLSEETNIDFSGFFVNLGVSLYII